MSFDVVINAERCKGCGLCIALCPVSIIVESDSLNSAGARPVAVQCMEKCTGCRCCAIICPDAAISIFRLSTTKSSIKKKQPAVRKPKEPKAHA